MSPAAGVVHPALGGGAAAVPLPAARLTDRRRLAVLLEGAALLSLLERAGWWLPRGWEGAGVATGGRLALPAAAVLPGRSPRPVQEQLRELLLRLFGGAAADPGAVAAASAAAAADAGSALAGSREPGEAGEAVAAPGHALLAGRGEARRAARELLTEWWQPLVPLPADEAVAQIVAAAPFLWMPSFAPARQSLAGELLGPSGSRLWVAGPSASRARLLAGCRANSELRARLGAADARTYWEGAVPPLAGGTPGTPASESARLQLAAASAGLGRFAAALGVLAPCRTPAARLLRSRCQLQLGRLGAARATLRRLEALSLQPAVAIEAAEVALRVFANSGEGEHVPRWVRRARAAARAAPSCDRARSFLVAAMAAWDREEPAAMGEPLEAARAALFDGDGEGGPPRSVPYLQALWRWHHARALQAMNAADGAAVVEHVARALRCGRRILARHEAAGLWNDLGIGRAQTGDLPQAERAFLHAQRLLARCDGPRRATLALHNLAEVRLRRGRTAGVREILAQSTAENRRGGNLRGLSQDTELWARLELVLGRPEQAAALCRAAIARLERRRSRWRREVLAVLLARALGWMQRPSEAAAELALASGESIKELEPEERPALWAHAGDRGAALRCAADLASPVGSLWLTVLSGDPPPSESWEALAGLEPYRAARLVFDLERAGAAGLLAPAAWRRPAITSLRQVGAGAMADWLEAREQGLWQALAAYAARPLGDLEGLAALMRQAGDPEARLCWLAAGEVRETAAAADPAPLPPVLLTGDLTAGRLEMHGRRLDPALAACFALAMRDLEASAAPRPAGLAGALAVAAPWPAASPAPPASPEAAPAAAPARGQAAAPAASPPAAPTAAPALPPAALPSGASGRLGAGRPAGASLVGSSPGLRAAVARLARLAAADIPVLIRGESGTGKELAAREIHRASARASGPFVAVNCAALAESLLLSDLFGHVRGAFTGADRDRVGVFETARGGTVLLDEIGDLPLGAQGLLLRVLQEGEVRRLGESLPRRVDVRVLAATHHDLEQAVAAGAFREDLFYRLKVGAVDLPPLRERGADVLQLADLFLSRRSPPPFPRLADETRERLLAYSWPGNVRELENVLRLAAALAAGGVILPEHLELPRSAGRARSKGSAAGGETPGGAAATAAAGGYHQQLESLRRRLVVEAIAAAVGNHAEAARRLGISRQALSYLVRQLGLR